MRQVTVIWGSLLAAWLAICPKFCHALPFSYSVSRGVTVDGVTFSSSAPGSFAISHSNTNDFGTASASISSYVGDRFVSLNGWAGIDAANKEEFSPGGRAVLFLDATFAIEQRYEWSLTALLIGTTDDEHWRASLSLTGPATNISYSAADHYMQVNETGILLPGEYLFSVRARPEVLGGLDGGSATAYIAGSFVEPNLTFLLTPFVDSTNRIPEFGVLATCASLCFVALTTRASTRYQYFPTHQN